MKKMDEILESVKNGLNSMLTKDTPKETIDFIASLNSELDEAKEVSKKTNEELSEMKDAYIKAIRKEGSTEKPKEDSHSPRSLEEIASETLKDKK